MIQDEIPKWLQKCIDRVFTATSLVFPNDKKPNHVLVNEYEARQGIMPHLDGPLYYPVIATISLQSSVLLDLYSQTTSKTITDQDKNSLGQNGETLKNQEQDSLKLEKIGSILLEPRSLYIATDEVYTTYLHGIREESIFDLSTENVFNLEQNVTSSGDVLKAEKILTRSKRVSVTIRHVPKVLKNRLFIR
ncbi:putative RNA/DNA demethylase ALKBH6 [Convolutriloba macropyga]|uniref:putative RNA/DNA demethylase ALKBH6 n=1 Tax=Convolutriloba macropyga TaxID=536237 RepID=UPI003F527177